jgi:hypothetical protein
MGWEIGYDGNGLRCKPPFSRPLTPIGQHCKGKEEGKNNALACFAWCFFGTAGHSELGVWRRVVLSPLLDFWTEQLAAHHLGTAAAAFQERVWIGFQQRSNVFPLKKIQVSPF